MVQESKAFHQQMDKAEDEVSLIVEIGMTIYFLIEIKILSSSVRHTKLYLAKPLNVTKVKKTKLFSFR
jgi:hypothetical protein